MSSVYRTRLKERIKSEHHPMNSGVEMQVHHLLSRKGFPKGKLGRELKRMGYDINDFGNLVSLPCTVRGACHLKVQLHCGDHSAVGDYDDDDHPKGYHWQVKILIVKNIRLKKVCRLPKHEIQEKMNGLSSKMLRRIQLYLVALTSVYRNFQPLSKMGCSGRRSVETLKKVKTPCPAERRHSDVNFHGEYILRAGH